jgi:hypothetical protein
MSMSVLCAVPKCGRYLLILLFKIPATHAFHPSHLDPCHPDFKVLDFDINFDIEDSKLSKLSSISKTTSLEAYSDVSWCGFYNEDCPITPDERKKKYYRSFVNKFQLEAPWNRNGSGLKRQIRCGHKFVLPQVRPAGHTHLMEYLNGFPSFNSPIAEALG